MPVTPSIFSLNYLKNSGQAPYQIVTVKADMVFFTDSNYQLRNVPSWLKVILEEIVYLNGSSTNVDHFKFRVSVDTSNANLLSEGLHSADLSFRLRVSISEFSSYWQSLNLKVSLTVSSDLPLEIDKTNFQFTYDIGNPAPPGQYLQITAASNWSISATQPWVNFNISNGNANASVVVSADVSGLDTGVYFAAFTVDDGSTQKTGNITLYVSGTGNTEDYLNVDQATFQFSESLGVTSAKNKPLNIESSLDGTVSSNVNWISLAPASFNSGQSVITVSLEATEALSVGSYYADITVTTSYGTKKIPVLLQIVEVQLSGIETNGFYYTEDRNKLLLTSTLANGEVIVNHTASSILETKKYTKRAPYFRNTANLIIGSETINLLEPYPVPKELHTHSFLPFKPVRIDLDVFDKDLTNNSLEERAEFQNLKFMNGRMPEVEGKFSFLPSKITLPKDGVLCFSFRSLEPVDYISITGAITTTIDIESLGDNIYGVMITLADFNLSEKDAIEIACGPVSLNVRIKPTVMPTSQIIWLNEWDCPEIFNATGIVQIVKGDGSTLVIRSKEGKEYKSIYDIKNPKKFKIGTGNLYGPEEIKYLSRIISAKKIWLQIDGARYEVIREFRDMLESETRKTVENITLTFKSAIT